MKRIYVATKARGFLLTLFKTEHENLVFQYKENQLYETNSKAKHIIAKLVKSKLADHLGLIQRLKVSDTDSTNVFSYNRFLKSDKDYVVCLENPFALVHYSINRNSTLLSKMKLKKYFQDKHLKAVVCLSKACLNTLDNVYEIPSSVKTTQIYPLIEKNPLTSLENIQSKSHSRDIQCLYISSKFTLKGGKDILECFKRLQQQGINNIKLVIITQLNSIDEKTHREITENKNIQAYDFKFSKDELNEFYNASSIMLNPSRQDSFSLVVLEAMKSGNAILTSDLYALSEMVEHDFNGYLVGPKFRFFNYDNMPNVAVWNHRSETIYSDYIDANMVEFLFKKLTYLNSNREELERLALNSYNKAVTGEFSEEYIKKKWSTIF
ncbi:glycosyltransferase family 4 protein [Paenibacillus sp. FSL M7-1046]|uniref:glycosyltransferase family 4 protein n=1 Tax=Paenibacillus sp. FSL M7-1046 TaxID=2975315 RepID=UPI0030F9D64B